MKLDGVINVKWTPGCPALLAILFTQALPAQFTGLAPTSDGASVYFASTLRLKDLAQPLNGKIYMATGGRVSLFRAREVASLPAGTPFCRVGGFEDYLGAETSSGGVVALLYRVKGSGCSYPPNRLMTQIVSRSGERRLPGILRLSSDGRHAIAFAGRTARPYDPVSISFVDPENGAQTAVEIPPATSSETGIYKVTHQPYGGGRVIANDGTALAGASYLFGGSSRGYLLKAGMDPKPFPVPDALPLFIDASGSKVLYQQQGLKLIDLRSLESIRLIPADVVVSRLGMSDDARRVVYLRDRQVHVLDTATLTGRTLTGEPAGVDQAVISSDGQSVFAVTGTGRLLKILADDGSETELIGHTPYLDPPAGLNMTPGLVTTLTGRGLSESVVEGTAPFKPWLGDVTMWIGERKVPITRLAPDSVSFLVPWDIQPEGGSIRVLVESPGGHTPFYFPEIIASLYPDPAPRAGAIFREEWSRTFVGPVKTGEVIHVYATGLGPVSPEVPEGAAAPSSEPLARITQTLRCSNAGILYAGLAPGAVERVYQIDMRIGSTPGYQQFVCTLGTLGFLFLTLNVVL